MSVCLSLPSCEQEGVSPVAGGALKVWQTQLAAALAAVRPPNTRNPSLAREPANKPALAFSAASLHSRERTQTRKCASPLSLPEPSPSEQTLGHFNI